MNSRYTAGIFAAIGGFLSFSILDSIVKYASQWYTPLVITTYLRICGTIAILIVMIVQSCVKRSLAPFATKHPYSHIIRGLLLVVISFAFTYGFSHVPLSTGYSIIFLLPIFTALCGYIFLKEKISRISGLAIIGGFIGILIVLRPGITSFSWGHVSFFIGIIAEAPFFVMMRHYHKNENPFAVIIYASILSTVIMVFIALLTETSLALITPYHIFIFTIGSVFYLLAQVLIIFSLSHLKAHTSISMQYTQIIWGVLLGALFFKEYDAFNIFFIIGVVIIITSSYTVATGIIPFSKKNKNLADK